MNNTGDFGHMTRVLITGGAGFIGRALVGKCLSNNCKVAVYDNLKVGRQSNLTAFEGKVLLFQDDIRDEAGLDRAFQSFAPERVIHLAALHFIPYCNACPQETLDVNINGTYAVLSACIRHGVKAVVFASSGALYASETHPLNEERDRPAPVDVYGLSKLLSEQVCAYFFRTQGLNCKIARLFNTYGPYETNMHILPEVMLQLHRGDKLELGNLDPKRDYIYVDDTAAALYSLCTLDNPGLEVFNVGTGIEYSVHDLLNTISNLFGRPLQISQTSDRIRRSDKLHQIADVTKLREYAEFTALININEGLKKLLVSEGLMKRSMEGDKNGKVCPETK